MKNTQNASTTGTSCGGVEGNTGITPGIPMRPEGLQEPAGCESPRTSRSMRLHDSVRLQVEGLKRGEM